MEGAGCNGPVHAAEKSVCSPCPRDERREVDRHDLRVQPILRYSRKYQQNGVAYFIPAWTNRNQFRPSVEVSRASTARLAPWSSGAGAPRIRGLDMGGIFRGKGLAHSLHRRPYTDPADVTLREADGFDDRIARQ